MRRLLSTFAASLIFCASQVFCSSQAPAETWGIDEVRGGALYHDVPGLWSGFSAEKPGLDANLELLFHPWGRAFGGVIRPALGTTINFRHDTSKAYADVRWEIEAQSGVLSGAFFGLGMGAAIHNGQLGDTDPARKALGSPVLFHPSAELGYRFDGANSISLFADHMSNGFTRRVNEGMDTVGVRLGHRFGGPTADDRQDAVVADFRGFYLGALGGIRANEADWNAGTPTTAQGRGGFVGGDAGYNWQSGHGVFGIEVDAASGAADLGTTCALPSAFCLIKAEGMFSVRPRFGWVVDRAMIYGTGGLAIAPWQARVVNVTGGQTLAGNRSTNFGVAVGGGIEYQFTANLTGRAEVIHYGLQGYNLTTSTGASISNQFQSTTGRVGLSYYFK